MLQWFKNLWTKKITTGAEESPTVRKALGLKMVRCQKCGRVQRRIKNVTLTVKKSGGTFYLHSLYMLSCRHTIKIRRKYADING